MREIHEVGKLAAESPVVGRVSRARTPWSRSASSLSQATCGRLLALNRKLYGLPHPKGGMPRERQDMPFKAQLSSQEILVGRCQVY